MRHSLIVEVVTESIVARASKEKGRIIKILIDIKREVLLNLPSPMLGDFMSCSRGIIDLRLIDHTVRAGIMSVSRPRVGRWSIPWMESRTFLTVSIEYCQLIPF